MTKKTFFALLWAYTLLFVVPPLIYILANFYTHLFDGWQLNPRFAEALGWLAITSVGYAVFGMIYDSNHRRWR